MLESRDLAWKAALPHRSVVPILPGKDCITWISSQEPSIANCVGDRPNMSWVSLVLCLQAKPFSRADPEWPLPEITSLYSTGKHDCVYIPFHTITAVGMQMHCVISDLCNTHWSLHNCITAFKWHFQRKMAASIHCNATNLYWNEHVASLQWPYNSMKWCDKSLQWQHSWNGMGSVHWNENKSLQWWHYSFD